jgi:peptidoglycan/xylan/chitin deacetylase (PgdA/CDA1 family)
LNKYLQMTFVENYSQIKTVKPAGLRGKLRSFALDLLCIKDKITGTDALLNKPRIQFLYIHHIFKDEEQHLDDLLKRLSEQHSFISYSDAVYKILTGEIDKPYICISSDDGFKNNIAAAEILNRYDAKACFFINPFIIETRSFTEVKDFCKMRLNFPPVEFMNWNDIESLQKGGHEIGSHTMEHINIAATDNNIFEADCLQTIKILNNKCGEAKHFAFPYGRFFHFNEAAREIVFKNGFESCATGERGCHINPETKLLKEELCILRDHVILDWKRDHIFHFLANNSRNASTANNLFPYKK